MTFKFCMCIFGQLERAVLDFFKFWFFGHILKKWSWFRIWVQKSQIQKVADSISVGFYRQSHLIDYPQKHKKVEKRKKNLSEVNQNEWTYKTLLILPI